MLKKIKFLHLILLIVLVGCEPNEYRLNFYHYDGSLIESKIIQNGENFSTPVHEDLDGKVFIGWDQNLDNINSNLEIFPVFETLSYQVTFLDFEGDIYIQKNFSYGETLEFPELPLIEGFEPVGWSSNVNVVTEDLTIEPLYEELWVTLELIDVSGETIENLQFTYGTVLVDLKEFETSDYYYAWFNIMSEPPIEFPLTLKADISLTRVIHSKNLEFKSYLNGYEVGAGNNEDTHLIIPQYFNGKPVIKISDYGFQYSLSQSVQIPSTVIDIGIKAFNGALNLKELDFAEGSRLKTIRWDAFAYNQSLTHVDLPNGLEHLEQGVFYNSNSLVSINLPRTLKSIGPYALTHSRNLETINVADGNRNFTSLDGILYTQNFETLLVYPSGRKNKTYTVHANTKVINNNAFDGASLETIFLNENLTEIKPFSFVGTSLKEIVFSEGLNKNLVTYDNSFFNVSSELTVYLNANLHDNLDSIDSIQLFKRELNIKNLTDRVVASSDISLNLLKNSWVVRENVFVEKNINTFRNWNSVTNEDYVYTYFYLNASGSLNLVFNFNPNQNIKIELSFNDETRILELTPNSIEYDWGMIDEINQGHHEIMFKFLESSNGDLGLAEITLEGTSINKGVGITDVNSSQMPASLHLWPQVPSSYGDIEWLYSEIVVEENNDILHTYFVANGFAQGYFGIQTNTTNFDERWVLFSIWSPFNTDNPNEIPDDLKVRLIRAGEGVEIREFGNEGSGGQSFLKYPWVVGNRYGFLTRVKPSSENSTQYTSYFYDFEINQWFLIATFERPSTHTYAKGWYQFLEVYTENYGNLERTGHYGNYWVKNTEGEWFTINRVLLTATDNARKGIRNDIDAGLSHYDGMIYLTTGGFNVSPVEIDRFILISPSNEKPVIDFDNLP